MRALVWARSMLVLLTLSGAGTISATAVPFAEHRAFVAWTPVPARDSIVSHKEPNRLVAAAFDLALGPFGVHRLYLGTTVKVPLIYGLTFGGFGVLVVIDLVEILFTKDLTPFRNNDKVFMWSKGRNGSTTPP